MKYAKCDFDKTRGEIKVNNGSLKWYDGDLEDAKMHVQEDNSCCVLFFPADVPGMGVPLKPDVSWEEFEKEPGVYGVCYYRGWRGYVFE